jgi:hypothetical protein
MKKPSIVGTTRLTLASLAMISLVSASGCTSIVMTPEAQRVVTQMGQEIGSCKPRGVVFALAPFSVDQPLDQLKIRASQIGADTIVLLNPAGIQTKDRSARAYRCGIVPPRDADATPLVTAAR